MSTLRVDSIQDTAGVDNQGKIIQVVNSTAAVARHQSTSTVFIDTDFSVTITPKFSNSKILINVCANGYSTSHYAYYDVYRDGTTSISGSATGGNGFALGAHGTAAWDTVVTFFEDSPNTTSAVTYNLFGRTSNGTLYVGRGTSAVYPNGVYLSATEIAQ